MVTQVRQQRPGAAACGSSIATISRQATQLFRHHQAGAQAEPVRRTPVGGPDLERNRAFFFGYYEGFNNRQGTTDTRVVLTQAQRTGDFSGGAAIRDPLTGRRFRAM